MPTLTFDHEPKPDPEEQSQPESASPKPTAHPVTLVNIDIPFWRLVRFLVKLVIASIPATIICWLLFFVFWMLFGTFVIMFTSLFSFMR